MYKYPLILFPEKYEKSNKKCMRKKGLNKKSKFKCIVCQGDSLFELINDRKIKVKSDGEVRLYVNVLASSICKMIIYHNKKIYDKISIHHESSGIYNGYYRFKLNLKLDVRKGDTFQIRFGRCFVYAKDNVIKFEEVNERKEQLKNNVGYKKIDESDYLNNLIHS